MHSSKPYCVQCRRAAPVALIFLMGLFQTHAWATGTASGTPITDIATLNYSAGDTPFEILSSPTGNPAEAGTLTTFDVGGKIDVVVTSVGGMAANVTSGQAGAVTTFSVTNTGNTSQDYALSSANLGNGTPLFAGTDNFDATDCKVFAETNGVAGFQPETDTATFIDELQQDTSRVVYVVCNIPAGQAGDEAVMDLIATVRIGLTPEVLGGEVARTPAIFFTDVAGSDDAIHDGKYSARNAYVIIPNK